MIRSMKAPMTHRPLATLAVASALFATLPALAAGEVVVPPEPQGVLSLGSSATVQVPNDWMTVQFSATRDGVDAAAVQAGLKDALATALAQARQVAKPDGHVEVQGGGFSLQPRFNTKGAITGWTGSTQMSVQGRDMSTIADLAGRVASMTVGNLSYSVSREAREKVEGDVAAQAIARFRAKAGDYAKAFGYAGFAIREVNVQTDGGAPSPAPMFRLRAAAPMEAALPVESGLGAVTSNVSGTIQMK
jgi:predicted secreted protein